jgi:hypothetical protein
MPAGHPGDRYLEETKKGIEKELAPLWDAGVRVIGESELGYEVDPDGLFDAGFDAVIISVGNWEESRHVVPGDDAALNGLELLKRVREHRAVKFTQKVAAIGDVSLPRRRAHGAAQGAMKSSSSPSTMPTTSRRAPATWPPSRRRQGQPGALARKAAAA